MAGNADFDAILSTTLKNYVPRLADNVFAARPLFYALTNGQTIRRVNGGAKIVVPIIYGKNTTAGSYSGADTIAITAQEGITAAEYAWKQYAATVLRVLKKQKITVKHKSLTFLRARLCKLSKPLLTT